MKKRILRMILTFFAVMLCCTFIARGASSMTVAKVKTEETVRGSLTEEFSGEGQVTAKDKIYQTIPEGQKVADHLVNPGDTVQEGDGILKLDLEMIEEQITEQEREIGKTELRIEQQTISGKPQARTPATAQAGLGVNRAKEALDTAENNFQQAKEAYEAAENQTSPGPEEEADRQESLRNLEEARDIAQAALQEAQSAYRQSLGEYGLAEQEDANSSANDASAKQISQAALGELQIDLDIQMEKLKSLQELKEAGGIVKARTAGVLGTIGAAEGTFATGIEQIVFETGGMEACGVIPDTKAVTVAVSDEIEIRVQGEAKKQTLTVERVGKNEEGAGVWYAPVSDSSYQSGTVFTYQYSRKSKETYQQLIPLSALREAGGNYYILIAEKRPGILGESYVAVRVGVTVLDKDDRYAAVETNLPEKAKVITESSKYVKEGDRVRIGG